MIFVAWKLVRCDNQSALRNHVIASGNSFLQINRVDGLVNRRSVDNATRIVINSIVANSVSRDL